MQVVCVLIDFRKRPYDLNCKLDRNLSLFMDLYADIILYISKCCQAMILKSSQHFLFPADKWHKRVRVELYKTFV